MKVWVLNDSSHYHAGCRSTTRALRKKLRRHEIVGVTKTGDYATPENFGGAEMVVVNGEGSMHHGANRNWPTHLIDALRRAQLDGRQTALVNTVWQENPHEWREVIYGCDRVGLRDPYSAESLPVVWPRTENMRVLGSSRTYPDLALDDVRRPNAYGPHKDRVVLGDAGCSGRQRLWEELRRMDLPEVHLDGETLQATVDALSGCRCYLTGQWHGVVAALVAGVPFAAVKSNSWKIESCLAWAGFAPEVRTDQQMLAAARGDQDGIGGSRETFDQLSRWYCTLPRMPEL